MDLELTKLPWTWYAREHCLRGDDESIIFDNSCDEFSAQEEKAIVDLLLSISENYVTPGHKLCEDCIHCRIWKGHVPGTKKKGYCCFDAPVSPGEQVHPFPVVSVERDWCSKYQLKR